MIGQPLHHNVQRLFPNLTDDNHLIMSPKTDNYNCIAWAYEVGNKWMWPGSPDYFWPSGVTGTDELATLVQLYLEGYEECENGEPEDEYKKVALYVKGDRPSHAALQLESGRWTSKLGRMQDIEHDTLEVLEGGAYGKAAIFLKKHRD